MPASHVLVTTVEESTALFVRNKVTCPGCSFEGYVDGELTDQRLTVTDHGDRSVRHPLVGMAAISRPEACPIH